MKIERIVGETSYTISGLTRREMLAIKLLYSAKRINGHDVYADIINGIDGTYTGEAIAAFPQLKIQGTWE